MSKYALYTVSFGEMNNRHFASFWSYQFAMRFFKECVEEGRLNVEFEVSEPEGDDV